MLRRRTQNIILVIKGNHTYQLDISMRDSVAKYMAETCGCDESDYSDAIIMQIISNCVMDIMENCSKDTCRRLMFDYFDSKSYSRNELDRWLIALDLMQIKNYQKTNPETGNRVYSFIKGFSQDYVIDENGNGELMYPELQR